MSHTASEEPRRHRYTVADYHRMGEVGILAPDARVELIDGEIIDMPPIGFHHSGTVDRLARVFIQSCGDQAIVRIQGSIQLGQHSEPQPDLAVLLPRRDFYTTSPAAPSDVLLVLEVAATSQRYDRVVKLPLYAHHSIPEVWLVDLEKMQLTRHRQLQLGQYVEIDRPALEVPLPIDALPGVGIDLRDLFGR